MTVFDGLFLHAMYSDPLEERGDSMITIVETLV